MPAWLRWSLVFTTPMNVVGAMMLGPMMPAVATLLGFPSAPGLYLAIVGWFVLLFGVAYGWMAWTGVPQRGVLALGAGGKAGFGAITAYYAAIGDVPPLVGLAGLPDLVLAAIFCTYLWQTRAGAAAATTTNVAV